MIRRIRINDNTLSNKVSVFFRFSINRWEYRFSQIQNMAVLTFPCLDNKMTDTRKCSLKCRDFSTTADNIAFRKQKVEESIIISQRQSPYLPLCTYLKVIRSFTSGGNGVAIFLWIGRSVTEGLFMSGLFLSALLFDHCAHSGLHKTDNCSNSSPN